MTSHESTESSGRIVIVDDNPDNLLALKTILDTQNYQTYAAINGKLAIDAIGRVFPDVILLDIMMPGMDGFQVCKHLKSHELTRDIPIMFISALGETIDKLKAFSLGGVDYIMKPFHAEEVLARVKTHVSLSRTYRKLKNTTDSLKRANKELEFFSYSVSHDLCAPLRRIAKFNELMMIDYSNSLDKGANDYMERIANNAKLMKRLIDAMLHLFSIGNNSLCRKQVDLGELATTIIRQLTNDHPGEQVVFQVEGNLDVMCDDALVAIVLTNLLSNAWKFTSKREYRTIKFGSMVQQGELVYFVKDNGVGFDMKFVDELFLPFQRLTECVEIEGTGIGLTTVQRIITMHGGRVWAEAQIDSGATFYFTLT